MMEWVSVLQVLIVIAGAVCAAPFLYVGIRLLRADPSEYAVARRTSGSLRNVILGQVEAEHNGQLNPAVSSGITIKERRRFRKVLSTDWLPQGKLASETVSALLHR